jgi:hypothetical protein
MLETSPATPLDFLVQRGALDRTRFAPATAVADLELAPGQVVLVVDTYAMTANNITYAVFGEAMNYWDFFPAPEGWGRVPVWGFAEIARSNHPELTVGERVFGYLPMSTYLVVQADDVSRGSFQDVSGHRAHLHHFYNVYSRTAGDPGYDPTAEAEQMLLRPLFATAFLLDDFVADNDFFGAEEIVLTSASSKTSFSMAWQLYRNHRGKVRVVGLTSSGNREFVQALGCYDQVVTYDEIETLDGARPRVIVDMAGDSEVLRRFHTHCRDGLRYSCMVGGTHWQQVSMGQELPGPTPTMFFAPTQLAKRTEDWGAAGLQLRLGRTWLEFLPVVREWIAVEHCSGTEAVERVYLDTLAGKASPKKGYVLSM